MSGNRIYPEEAFVRSIADDLITVTPISREELILEIKKQRPLQRIRHDMEMILKKHCK